MTSLLLAGAQSRTPPARGTWPALLYSDDLGMSFEDWVNGDGPTWLGYVCSSWRGGYLVKRKPQ